MTSPLHWHYRTPLNTLSQILGVPTTGPQGVSFDTLQPDLSFFWPMGVDPQDGVGLYCLVSTPRCHDNQCVYVSLHAKGSPGVIEQSIPHWGLYHEGDIPQHKLGSFVARQTRIYANQALRWVGYHAPSVLADATYGWYPFGG